MLARREMEIGAVRAVSGGGGGVGAEVWEFAAGSAGAAAPGLLARSFAGTVEGLNANLFFGANVERVSWSFPLRALIA